MTRVRTWNLENAIQEVLDPNALDDLMDRLNGGWHTALADPDTRRIRVGLLSRTTLSDLEQIRDFAHGLSPVQATMTAPPSASSADRAYGHGSDPDPARTTRLRGRHRRVRPNPTPETPNGCGTRRR